MRRILSILFTLVLSLGPVWASVPTGALASGWTGKVDESRLPACCRRNGVHHCGMVSQDTGTQTSVSGTGCCPCWPHTLASTASQLATTAAANSLLRISLEHRSILLSTIPATIGERRAQPKRGPPPSEIL